MRRVGQRRYLALLGVYLAASASALTTIDGSPDDYLEKVRHLEPGMTLQLAAGEYRGGLYLHELSGTAAAPVIIRGPAKGSAAIFVAREGHNTVSVADSSYLELRNLTLDGKGLAVDAVKGEGNAHWAHHITLENLRIVGHGANQQIVGISTKCPAWNWVIRGNEIRGAGTGMYFGNSDGSAPFIAGIIEDNVVADTIGYNLQIKHQLPRPAIDGMPTAPQVTVIRRNRFSKEHGGSSGPEARPNVLVGHWPLSGPGQEDLYLIYGNFFYQNWDEALFQGEGRLALYNNVFVNRLNDAIHIQPHNDQVREVRILFNSVLTPQSGVIIRVPEAAPKPRLVIDANAVFAAHTIVGHPMLGNVVGDYAHADGYFKRPYSSPPELDLTPTVKVHSASPFNSDAAADLLDIKIDFDEHPRTVPVAGAYASASSPLRRPLTLGRVPPTHVPSN
ncbi:MAG: hypothetical protein HYX63_01070 [Gammaproteobacteria bacterium]|nr:hypothetical protein [Gammaproteobacteria bacterium]